MSPARHEFETHFVCHFAFPTCSLKRWVPLKVLEGASQPPNQPVVIDTKQLQPVQRVVNAGATRGWEWVGDRTHPQKSRRFYDKSPYHRGAKRDNTTPTAVLQYTCGHTALSTQQTTDGKYVRRRVCQGKTSSPVCCSTAVDSLGLCVAH